MIILQLTYFLHGTIWLGVNKHCHVHLTSLQLKNPLRWALNVYVIIRRGTSTSLFVRKGDLMKIMKVHLSATYSWCICTVLYVCKWVIVVFLLMRYNICLQKSNCCYWKFTTNISLLVYNNRISCPIHKWSFY